MSAEVQTIRIRVRPDGDADTSYLEQDEFADRLEAFRNGAFNFVGVQVEAEIVIAVNGQGIGQTITTPGLWGVEDDSGEDYFRDVASDEWETLREMLNELGVDLPNDDGLDYTDAPIVYTT